MSKPKVTRCQWVKDCPNPPGGRWSPYFCKPHDEERMAHLSKQFAALSESHPKEPTDGR